MTADKPICSLSLDLDNKWSYMKTHGDPGWESYPSYLDLVVPRFLKILDDFGWKITVFVVGQDAARDKNREALQMIADAGHEIGNHSFNHEPWLHLYSKQQVEDEICRAEEAIEGATGQRPRGFRGPGYSISPATLRVLAGRGYLYDASSFPTFLGPLARAYYFFKSDLSNNEKTKRKRLFGRLRDGFQSLTPYYWDLEDCSLLEIPVTTLPVLRVPIHFSYQLYLASFSTLLTKMYFRSSLAICHLAGIKPSLLLHPLDFLSCSDFPELDFFPSMSLEVSQKADLLRYMFACLSKRCSVVGMREHSSLGSKRSTPRRPFPKRYPANPSDKKPDQLR